MFNFLLLGINFSVNSIRPKKKQPEIPITLPTLNYPATLFHIFIFMQIYAHFYLIMLIYANFKDIFYEFFLIKLKNLAECQINNLNEMLN